MRCKSLASGLCWFAATCLALAMFGLALASIEGHAGGVGMRDAPALLVLSVLALIMMVLLIALAFRIEHRAERRGPMHFRK